MCAAVAEHVAVEAEIRAERRRILMTLLDELDGVVERAVVALRAEIPAYREGGERFQEDLRAQVGAHFRVKLGALLEERMVTVEDIAFVRAAATRRARSGYALEDYLNAFRVGQQAFWEAVLDCAGESPFGHEAALTLAAPLMRYCDFASTHAARAYVEYQQYMVADADRERRDLLEHLLAGEMPTRGPLLAAAQAHGIAAYARMMVATAVTVDARVDDDAPHVGSAAIACAGLHEAKTLVVVRQTESVAVLVLGADGDPCRLCDRVDALQARLCREGIALAIGVSTVANGVGDLPRAYEEAHVARPGGRRRRRRGARTDVAVRLSGASRRRHGAAPRRPAPTRLPRGGSPARAGSHRDDRGACRGRPQRPSGRRAPAGASEHRPVPPAPHRGAHRPQPAADRRPGRPVRRDRARRRGLTARLRSTPPPG